MKDGVLQYKLLFNFAVEFPILMYRNIHDEPSKVDIDVIGIKNAALESIAELELHNALADLTSETEERYAGRPRNIVRQIQVLE